MAYGNYLVSAPGDALPQLSKNIAAAVGTVAGDPLIVISTTRSIISRGVGGDEQ